MVQGSLAAELGDIASSGEDSFFHKAGHFAAGAVGGSILHPDDPLRGALGGGIGAAVAETMAEVAHEQGFSAPSAATVGRMTGTLAGGMADIFTGGDGALGAEAAATTASVAVENNFLRHLDAINETEEEPCDDDAGSVNTDEGAEETGVGRARHLYTDPLGELGEATGVSQIGSATGAYHERLSGGEDAYVASRIESDERLRGRPYTSSERAILEEIYREHYSEDAGVFLFAEGLGTVTNVGGAVDLGLRYSGVTDKYTARAVGRAVNDTAAFVSVGGAARAAVRGAARGVTSRAGLSATSRPAASGAGGTAVRGERSALGRAIRAEGIPSGSKLEYLGPGRVRFEGVEFRGVRDLGHLSERDLLKMRKTGVAPRDISGSPLEGHHHRQIYHREPGAFVVEIPEPSHCISNPVQHPLGRTGGLTATERSDWNKLRLSFHKERAKTELLRRGHGE